MDAHHVRRGQAASSADGTSRPLSRRMRAARLLPVTLVTALCAVSVSGAGAATMFHAHRSASARHSASGRIVNQPATLPVPDEIGPAVPYGAADTVVSTADVWGIPSPALSAYQQAAQIIDVTDSSCHLGWELLAAIGRVESNHGQYGGSVLNPNGVSTPAIFGPELDGTHGTQNVADTDHGRIDHDTAHDRAVGPMQFLPATWAAVKVDGDSDGISNPQDIHDAALAAAVYLCSGTDDLATDSGRRAALMRYNRSTAYGALVLRVMDAYSHDAYSAVPGGSYGGTLLVASAPVHSAATKQPTRSTAQATTAPATPPQSSATAGPVASKPAPAPEAKSSGLPGFVGAIVGGSAPHVATGILTSTQATVACLEKGVSTLDVLALARCVTDLLAPVN
ncbi:MAG: secreted protein [Marmoricola sp.]|nr:secreted protein [Marmoricola sp.]